MCGSARLGTGVDVGHRICVYVGQFATCTHAMACTTLLHTQVYLRKGRLLLALRAVKCAHALAGRDDPVAHSMLVRLCKAFTELQAGGGTADGQSAEGEAASARLIVCGLLCMQPFFGFHMYCIVIDRSSQTLGPTIGQHGRLHLCATCRTLLQPHRQ